MERGEHLCRSAGNWGGAAKNRTRRLPERRRRLGRRRSSVGGLARARDARSAGRRRGGSSVYGPHLSSELRRFGSERGGLQPGLTAGALVTAGRVPDDQLDRARAVELLARARCLRDAAPETVTASGTSSGKLGRRSHDASIGARVRGSWEGARQVRRREAERAGERKRRVGRQDGWGRQGQRRGPVAPRVGRGGLGGARGRWSRCGVAMSS